MPDLAAILDAFIKEGVPAGYVRRSGYNGDACRVDLAKPVDFVSERGKIVVNKEGQLDLTASIAWQLTVSAPEPENANAFALDETHLNSASEAISNIADVWSIYRIATAAGVKIATRKTDHAMLNPGIISKLDSIGNVAPVAAPSAPAADGLAAAADDATAVVDNRAEAAADAPVVAAAEDAAAAADVGPTSSYVEVIAKAALAIEAQIVTGEVSESVSAANANSDCVVHAIIANAVHRHTTGGHNWYSAQTNVKGSPTNRILGVAGGIKTNFSGFMSKFGHDLFHHLTDASLHDLACALTDGEGAVKVDHEVKYRGESIKGKLVSEVLPVDDAARNRYPAGALGKSALILGIDATLAMLDSIAAKVLISDTNRIVVALQGIRSKINDIDCLRKEVIKAKTMLNEIIAVAYGYVDRGNIGDFNSHPSLKSASEKLPAATGRGAALYTAIASAPVHNAALTASVANALSNITGAINLYEGRTDAAKITGYEAKDIVIGEASEVSSHNRMLELLKSSRG